jgi:predicted DCC family thiol-disulfide oxidoreductase YuxK
MTRLRNPVETAVVLSLLALGLAHPGFAVAGALAFAALEIVAGLRGVRGPRWLPSAWPVDAPPLTVVYDGHCRLCVGTTDRLKRWASADRMTFVPLEDPRARALLPDRSDAELQGQMHVLEEGRVYAGADGWFRLMRRAPLWSAWIGRVTPRALARPVYGWIAKNRYRWFGRACEEGSCALHVTASGGRRSSTPNGSRDPS